MDREVRMLLGPTIDQNDQLVESRFAYAANDNGRVGGDVGLHAVLECAIGAGPSGAVASAAGIDEHSAGRRRRLVLDARL